MNLASRCAQFWTDLCALQSRDFSDGDVPKFGAIFAHASVGSSFALAVPGFVGACSRSHNAAASWSRAISSPRVLMGAAAHGVLYKKEPPR
jgi:hypothetical protein